MTLLPEVPVIDALRPSALSASGERLEYPNLEAIVAEQRQLRKLREGVLAQANGWEAARAKQDLAKQELLECALRLQHADGAEAKRLAAQFTKLSTVLYGAPDRAAALALIAADRRALAELEGRPNVDQRLLRRVQAFYDRNCPVPAGAPADTPEAAHRAVAAAVKEYFWGHFGPALKAVAPIDSRTSLAPPEIAVYFKAGLRELQAINPEWRNWEVILKDAGSLSVSCGSRKIIVGQRREPLEAASLPGKFAHEVLVHALRQVNAVTSGQPELSHGFADYTNAEEGLASFVEYAITGSLSRRIMERYIDIAFALGYWNEPATRRDLFDMALARRMVFGQAAGGSPELHTLATGVWEHVNRIYRGTPGNEIVGVFTKDAVYHQGFQAIGAYLQTESAHRPLSAVLDFLLACKFNPFDAAQAAFVAERLEAVRAEGAAA